MIATTVSSTHGLCRWHTERRFRAADGRICCGIRVAAFTGFCFVACLLPGGGCTGLAGGGYGTGVEGAAAGMAAAGVHGFPAVLTSFVGRGGAVREIAGLLAEFRLVTVTGPGGS